MTQRPFVADDYGAIRGRMEELANKPAEASVDNWAYQCPGTTKTDNLDHDQQVAVGWHLVCQRDTHGRRCGWQSSRYCEKLGVCAINMPYDKLVSELKKRGLS